MWDISFDPKIMVGALCRSTYIFSPLMCNPVRSFSAYLYIWVNYNFLGTSILSIYVLTISQLPIRLYDLDCYVLYVLHMRIVSKSYLYYQYSNENCHVFTMVKTIYLVDPLGRFNPAVCWKYSSCSIYLIVSSILFMVGVSNQMFFLNGISTPRLIIINNDIYDSLYEISS